MESADYSWAAKAESADYSADYSWAAKAGDVFHSYYEVGNERKANGNEAAGPVTSIFDPRIASKYEAINQFVHSLIWSNKNVDSSIK